MAVVPGICGSCAGDAGGCGCVLEEGDNITITGTGSVDDPFVISAVVAAACYAPAMTRAAALALRTAGTLVVGCPVLITDGPTIGTTGNTSTTSVLLWPVSATEFGMDAVVNTTFDNNGWAGLYDIDLSGGTIVALRDNLGNELADATGANILNQFPWGFAAVRNNRIKADGAALSGWGQAATAGATLSGNEIVGGSSATISVGGALTLSRLASGASLTTGAFTQTAVVIDGQFTKTATAANTNALVNKSFDDLI